MLVSSCDLTLTQQRRVDLVSDSNVYANSLENYRRYNLNRTNIENCLYSLDIATFNASFLCVIELRRSKAASQAIWPMTLRCTLITDRIIAEISIYTNIFIRPDIDNCTNSLDIASVNAGFFFHVI